MFYSREDVRISLVEGDCLPTNKNTNLSLMASTSLTNQIVIRKAEPRDCAQIFALMQELTVFLKCEKEMKLTVDQFYQDLFGEKPVVFCIVATTQEDPSTVIGYSLFFHIYNYLEGFAISMENLYVNQTHRGKGIGKILWKEVTRIGLELGSTGILICTDGWNKPTRDWYMRYGCVDLLESKDQRYMNMGREEMEALVKET